MRGKALKSPDQPATHPQTNGAVDCPVLDDLRFRQLLPKGAWASLPAAVRQRFGKRLAAGESANYAGQILACRTTLSGWLLAQICRLIGAPLPLESASGLAAIVSVTEDGAGGGQTWTRVYARTRGFPQVIHSVKRFAGPTGLEEYLGKGFGIALAVEALPQGLRFSSQHYFWQLGQWRLQIPRWLAPGRLTIDHLDQGEGHFTFTLSLFHPLFGEVMHQHSCFSDQSSRHKGPSDD